MIFNAIFFVPWLLRCRPFWPTWEKVKLELSKNLKLSFLIFKHKFLTIWFAAALSTLILPVSVNKKTNQIQYQINIQISNSSVKSPNNQITKSPNKNHWQIFQSRYNLIKGLSPISVWWVHPRYYVFNHVLNPGTISYD